MLSSVAVQGGSLLTQMYERIKEIKKAGEAKVLKLWESARAGVCCSKMHQQNVLAYYISRPFV